MVVFATPEDGNRSRALARPAPAPSIRLAREEELGAIASLFGPALAPYRGAGADEILDAYLAELLDVRSRFAVAETYVAVENGSVLGSVAFYRDVLLEGWSSFPPGWAGFRALAVSPVARGGGIGRRLVERCLDRAREAGATTLGIHTIETLVDAVRLYERLGFVRSPEFDLRAADVFPSDAPIQSDLVGMAFRREL